MQIVFISNFINHHQAPVADEIYKALGNDYTFIATEPMTAEFVQSGYPDYSDRPYLLKAYESVQKKAEAHSLIDNADIVIKGHASDNLIVRRLETGKITFRNCERFFKSKPWYLTGPAGWIHFMKYYVRYNNNPSYMLASSAYTANDMYHVGAYKGKVLKWGYFTQVNNNLQGGVNLDNHIVEDGDDVMRIMWCARFIGWKHPEMVVQLAAQLKKDGYKFIIDMYGTGPELEKVKDLASKLNVSEEIVFLGNVPNSQILEDMSKHHAFLFTSDQNEGWGAVMNEAMSRGCAVVASNKIGATPFLIKNGVNGLVFKSGSVKSLYGEVRKLFDDKELCRDLGQAALITMQDVWNPRIAAERLILLCDNLLKGLFAPQEEGPCSIAKPMKYDFYKIERLE